MTLIGEKQVKQEPKEDYSQYHRVVYGGVSESEDDDFDCRLTVDNLCFPMVERKFKPKIEPKDEPMEMGEQSPSNWNDEMSEMLDFIDLRMGTIKKARESIGLAFDSNFKEEFLHIVNNRINTNYNQFEVIPLSNDEGKDHEDVNASKSDTVSQSSSNGTLSNAPNAPVNPKTENVSDDSNWDEDEVEYVIEPDTDSNSEPSADINAIDSSDEEDENEVSNKDLQTSIIASENTNKQNSTARKFKCQFCSYSSVSKGHSREHTRIHTGEKPFECNQCSKKFIHSCNWKRHMLTHTGEKAFGCDQCSKKFGQSSTLKTHMLTHTGEKPFGCDQCSKKFGQSSTLKTHMLTHTGEMPFGCDQCSKKFGQSSTLKTHMLTHTGEKPFECNQCNQKFTRRETLKTHSRTHSKK